MAAVVTWITGIHVMHTNVGMAAIHETAATTVLFY